MTCTSGTSGLTNDAPGRTPCASRAGPAPAGAPASAESLTRLGVAMLEGAELRVGEGSSDAANRLGGGCLPHDTTLIPPRQLAPCYRTPPRRNRLRSARDSERADGLIDLSLR